MPTIEHIWKCDVCGQTYHSTERAQSCENKHTPLGAIKIVRVVHDNVMNGFPLHLEVEIDSKNSAGMLGTFELLQLYDKHSKELIYKRMNRY